MGSPPTWRSSRFYIRRFPNFFDTCLVIRPSITDKCIDAVRWSNSCQLRAAGLSVALAGGASAATKAPAATMLMPNNGASHEITLREEEISDVSLAKFYVFEKEKAGTFRPGLRLAQGAGCGGCGCWTGSYYTSSDAYPPPSRPVPPTRRHVQKKP